MNDFYYFLGGATAGLLLSYHMGWLHWIDTFVKLGICK